MHEFSTDGFEAFEERFENSPSLLPYTLNDFPGAVDCSVTRWHVETANDQLRKANIEEAVARQFASDRSAMAEEAFEALSRWRKEAESEYENWSYYLVRLAFHHGLTHNPNTDKLIHRTQAQNPNYYSNLCQIGMSANNQAQAYTQNAVYEACAEVLATHSQRHDEAGFVCKPAPYMQQ